MRWAWLLFVLLLLSGCASEPRTFLRKEPEELKEALVSYYQVWKKNYLVQDGEDAEGLPYYRVVYEPGDPLVTVSEGQGYGMRIVVEMAPFDPEAREIFDGLYRFARDHPSSIDPRLMGWRVPQDPEGNDAAFDGDADIAYALLLAEARWGGGVYLEAARTRIQAIWESMIGPESKLPLLGDWVDPKGETYNEYTPRISDFMPKVFLAFAQADPDHDWEAVIEASDRALTEVMNQGTGLVPDFAEPVAGLGFPLRPADPNFLEGPYDGDYYYNAGRYPWRVGAYLLAGGGGSWRDRLSVLSHWVERKTGGDPYRIPIGYRLDGEPIEEGYSIFFAAPLLVAAVAQPDQEAWAEALFAAVSDRHELGYEDSVTLLALIEVLRDRVF